VAALQTAGFRLGEIRELVQMATAPSVDTQRMETIADAKLAELDSAIASLQRSRSALSAARNCPCNGKLSRCDFGRTRAKPAHPL
jgi:DNA-binding transcriptional MerR regulator